MKDQEKKKITEEVGKLIEEDEERIVQFLRHIEGYELDGFKLWCVLSQYHDEEDTQPCIDTLYLYNEAVGGLDMVMVIPPIPLFELREHHFSNYKYENGCRILGRNGYFMIMTHKDGD